MSLDVLDLENHTQGRIPDFRLWRFQPLNVEWVASVPGARPPRNPILLFSHTFSRKIAHVKGPRPPPTGPRPPQQEILDPPLQTFCLCYCLCLVPGFRRNWGITNNFACHNGSLFLAHLVNQPKSLFYHALSVMCRRLRLCTPLLATDLNIEISYLVHTYTNALPPPPPNMHIRYLVILTCSF